MKSLTQLACSSFLLLFSFTFLACRTTSHQTIAVSTPTKETAVKEEVTVAKNEESALKTEVNMAKEKAIAAKKEEQAVEVSAPLVESAPLEEPVADRPVKPIGPAFNGGASYYADHFHGKKTATGELYDRAKKTAAIRTNALPFPFGTLVQVTSIKTGRSVVVRVNDKMSDKAKGIIDLSYEAAEAIGLILEGRTEVTVQEVLEHGK